MIGRETESAALAWLLRDPQCRLLTLVGPGGIGKTRLAIQTAFAQQELFSGGAFFVSLMSLSSPQFIVSAIADALRFTFSGPLDPWLQLFNHLREKCLLLVLDNFEHLLEGGELLAELLLHTPEAKLLVTSRERLNLQGEWLFDLQGLPVPPQAADRPAAARICRLVEGMPLAIESFALAHPNFVNALLPDHLQEEGGVRPAKNRHDLFAVERLSHYSGCWEKSSASPLGLRCSHTALEALQ